MLKIKREMNKKNDLVNILLYFTNWKPNLSTTKSYCLLPVYNFDNRVEYEDVLIVSIWIQIQIQTHQVSVWKTKKTNYINQKLMSTESIIMHWSAINLNITVNHLLFTFLNIFDVFSFKTKSS